MKKVYPYIIMAILVAGIDSCNKNRLETNCDNDIAFDVIAYGQISSSDNGTKGQRFNSESEFAKQTFGMYAWNSSTGDTEVYSNELVSKNDDNKWVPDNGHKWNEKHSYVFEAVYPQPYEASTIGLTSLTTDPDPSKLKFSYKVPGTTMSEGDNDFMLAYYSGLGTEGVAPLTFTHPLSCVNFKGGSLSGVETINSISIIGVYESGECSVRLTNYDTNNEHRPCYAYVDEDNVSLWKPDDSRITVTGASKIDVEEKISSLSTTWAYNFLIIPQDTSVDEAVIRINITTSNGATFNVSATINSDNWCAGFTNTYSINFNAGGKLSLDPVVTHWGIEDQGELPLS